MPNYKLTLPNGQEFDVESEKELSDIDVYRYAQIQQRNEEYVASKKAEIAAAQEASAQIMEAAPGKTWAEQVSARPEQKRRVPIPMPVPMVAIPFPSMESAPTIPASPLEPLMPLPKYEIAPDESKLSAGLKAGANLLIGVPEFMTSTLGMAAIPSAAIAPTATSGLFTADMVKSLMEQAPDAYENWDSLTPAQKTEVAINLFGTGAFATFLGKKTLTGTREALQRQLANIKRRNLPPVGQQIPLPPASSLLGTQPQQATPVRPPTSGPISPVFAPTPTPPAPGSPSGPSTTPTLPPAIPPVPKPLDPQPAPILRVAAEVERQAERVAEPTALTPVRLEDTPLPAEPPVLTTRETPARPQPAVAETTAEQVAATERGGAPSPPADVGISTTEAISQEKQPTQGVPDAIQERGAAAILVGEGAEGGAKVGRQVRNAEEAAVPQVEGATEVQPSGAKEAEVAPKSEATDPSAKPTSKSVEELEREHYRISEEVERAEREKGNATEEQYARLKAAEDAAIAVERGIESEKSPPQEAPQPILPSPAPAPGTPKQTGGSKPTTSPPPSAGAGGTSQPVERLLIKPRTDGLVSLEDSKGNRLGTFKTADEAAKAATDLGYKIAPGSPLKPTVQQRVAAPPVPSSVTPSTTLPPASKPKRGRKAKQPAQQQTPQAQPPAKPGQPQPFTPAALKTPKGKTLGIVAGQPLPQLDPIGTKIKNYLKKLFQGQGMRPDLLFGAELKMGHRREAYNRTMERLNVDLRRAIRHTYGISALSEATGGFRRLPQQSVEMMMDYLEGKIYNSSQIPAEIRGVLDNMRAVVDGLSTELANQLRAKAASLGPRQQAQAKALRDYADRILQNRDHYLHRSYAFFDSTLNATDWFQQMPTAVRQVAENYIQNTKGVSLIEAQRELVKWMEDLKPTLGQGRSVPGTSKLGSMDLSTSMRRKPIPAELRALLGEYRDPLTNFTKTVSKLAQRVTAQEFLNNVREVGLRDGWLFRENQAPPGWQVEIAGKGSDPMHPMNGLRTSPEIAEIFTEYAREMERPPVWLRAYYKLNAIAKGAATTQSVMTHQRNLLGQPYFWGMSGHWNRSALRQAMGAIKEEVTKGGDAGMRAYLDDAANYGILGTTARFGELRDVLRDAEFARATPDQLTEWNWMGAVKEWAYEKPAKLYRMTDEFGKLVGWEAEQANVRAVNPTWTPEQVKAEAANRVRLMYADYSMTSPFVRAFRKLPIGPFVTFPIEMIRTSTNAIGLSIREMRSSNPVERRIGRRRMASQLATLSSPFVLSAATAWMFGVSGEEEDDFRAFQSEHAKNSQFAWMPSKPGDRNTINLSYLNPYNYMDVVQSAISGIRSGQDFGDIAVRSAKEFLSPYLSEQMFATALLDWARNQTQTGSRVYNPQDDGQTVVRKVLTHLVTPVLPGTVQRAMKRTIPSFYEPQTEYGRNLNPTREIAREVTGISMDGFNYKRGLGFGARAFKRDTNDSEDKFREPLNKQSPMTDQEMVDAYVSADRSRQEAWSSMRLKYLAALRRGVPQGEAVQALLDNGIGKNEAKSIIAGVYIPYEVSKEVYARALKKGKTIPLQAIEDYRRSVIGKSTAKP